MFKRSRIASFLHTNIVTTLQNIEIGSISFKAIIRSVILKEKDLKKLMLQLCLQDIGYCLVNDFTVHLFMRISIFADNHSRG